MDGSQDHKSHDQSPGGRFHSGDLGVMQPDHYLPLKDRSGDIIIPGGENILRERLISFTE